MTKKIAVTGANGFIGAHCVFQLLEAGFDVVAVVRDPTNETKTQFLKDEAAKLGKYDNLSFGAGDLSKSGSYDEAFSGCWGILHTAAVVELGSVKDPYESVVKPAVEGTKIVIDSIKKNSSTIERFVNISSIAAVMSLEKDRDSYIFNDEDWNTWSTVEKGDAYGYAKTEAEKAVYADEDLKKCVPTILSINPTVVIGPCFTKTHANGGSASIVTGVMYGTSSPNVSFFMVDVRDVAKGATLGFTQDAQAVAGQRFILNATETTSMKELSKIVKKVYPSAKGLTKFVSEALTYALNATVWLGSKFPILEKVGYTEYIGAMELLPLLKLDNNKSKTVLGIGEYRDFEETCKDATESIAEIFGAEEE